MSTFPLWKAFRPRPKGKPIVLYFDSLNSKEQQEWRDHVRDVASAERDLAEALKVFSFRRSLKGLPLQLKHTFAELRLNAYEQRLLSKYRCDELRGFPRP
jgi:hypothetical protein